MNCPTCLDQGVVFPMRVVSASTTIEAPFPHTDERGVIHAHDPTVTVVVYRCPVDHEWSTVESRACWCGWKAA